MTNETIARIRWLFKGGWSPRRIAEELELSPLAVGRALRLGGAASTTSRGEGEEV